MEYIIFAVGVLVTLMVCGGLFYATANEMVSHAFHSSDEKKPIKMQTETKTKS